MKYARGFTLIELVVVLALASILVTIAVPSFRGFFQDSRATTESNLLLSALTLARNSAVTQGVPVSVCAANTSRTNCAGSNTDWGQGWLVFTDGGSTPGSLDTNSSEKVLKIFPALGKQSTISTGVSFLQYLPEGKLNSSLIPATALNSASMVEMKLAVSPCTSNRGRDVTVMLTGYASVSKIACP